MICVLSDTFARVTDDSDSSHEGALARVLGGEWANLRAEVLTASVLQKIGVPLVKIGRFDALVCIGEGGFGTVFKARDPKLGRLVALKLCRTRSSNVVDGIMNEAMALAQLEHPNIVTIFELGEHDGAVFFAMRYLAGKNAERFAERDPLPTCKEVLKVYRHVARGLAAAHARKYVHGDVKPSNILLDTDDFAYIADFGLARRMIEDADESEREELRRGGGTMYYTAPEVLAGGRYDARSDQFSFFVALYQTLTGGKLPFYGKTSGEVLEAIENTDIRDLIDPSWPVALQVVLRIGLSLDPDERFPDMEAVEAEIDRLLQTPPPSSPPRDEPESDEPESDEPESDEPESDEPESDEPKSPPDEPERMHAPESLDEPALMLGPEVMVGEPPLIELDLVLGESPAGEPELIPPTEGPELTPLGGGPAPSKAKRGVLSASLLLAVGLTLGWAGRGRVEDPRPSDPVPLPSSSPCALGDEPGVSVEIDPVVLAVCTYIRRGAIDDADKTWESVYLARWAEIESLTAAATLDPAASATLDPAEAADKLAADTMIIVQTFQEWAKLSGGPDVAKANKFAREWTPLADQALAQAKKIREKKSGRAEQPAPK
jgi:serine/threonine protein kinase